MEFKCSICGKTYTNRKDMVACTIECDNAQTAKEELEKRKKSESEVAEIEKQLDFHYKEVLRLTQELYKIKPRNSANDWIINMVWPDFSKW